MEGNTQKQTNCIKIWCNLHATTAIDKGCSLQLARPKEFSAASVKYGIANEHSAVMMYCDIQHHMQRGVAMFPCGVMVRPDCPWLGATPDRIVFDCTETPHYGVLEVKCPSSKKAVSLQEALAYKNFCIELVDGKAFLKISHEYYYQPMGQMFCTDMVRGHFVVYSPLWVIITKVEFCETFCQDVVNHLINLYFETALPYLDGLL